MSHVFVRWARSMSAVCLLLVLAAPQLDSQTEGLPTQESLAYELLFRNLARLQRRIDDLNKAGDLGRHLRTSVCSRMALDDQSCAATLDASVRVVAQLANLDRRAQSIILEVRERHKQRAPGTVLPPPPAELVQLQSERERIVNQTAVGLNARLSPSAATTFRAFVGNRADRVSVGTPAEKLP